MDSTADALVPRQLLSAQTDGRAVPATSALARPRAGAAAPLGSIGKSSSATPKAARAQRYQALTVARGWLRRLAVKDPTKPFGWRVHLTGTCLYTRVGIHVSLHQSQEFGSVHYGDLATCGSVWACPLCAAKIQARRRPELEKLVEWAYSQGYQVQMVTFTFPHYGFQRLAQLIPNQREAFKTMRGGRPWQTFKKGYGFVGMVRSLEVTHGANGWHPHTHELWITKDLTEARRGHFQAEVIKHWRNACMKAGLLLDDPATVFAFDLHAVNIQWDVSSSDYLAKQDTSRSWGIDAEMASQSSKQGRVAGVHPHEFLVRQGEGDHERYLEYVQGMHGSRQLFWSPGLKALVGVNEVSDEELAKRQDDKAYLLGFLSAEQWRFVRGNDARAELLDAAESGGMQAVQSLLLALGCPNVEFPVHGANEVGQVDSLTFGPVNQLDQSVS